MEAAVQHKTVNRTATVQPAAALQVVQRRAVPAASAMRVQAAMKISSPHDPAEKEAEATAKKVMRMTVPEGSAAWVGGTGDGGGVLRQVRPDEKEKQDKKLQPRLRSPHISRFADAGIWTARSPKEEEQPDRKPDGRLQRKAEGQPNVSSNVAAEIQSGTASGSPLPLSVRRFMEPRFQADFGGVKVHTGDRAAGLNRQLNAQAFTVGNQIFFGRDRFRPESSEGRELIAHELTHTVQQGAAVQRREAVAVAQMSPVMVQRLGLSDALDYFADKANMIPGFRMFTIILGINPINMSRVERSAANILRAIVEFIPGGGLITQALDNHGVFEKVGAWVEQQIRSLGMTGAAIKKAVTDFLDSLSWKDIFDLGGVWNRAKRIFTEPIDRIISFGKGLITGIIKFVKDAILRPLAKLAEGTRGYDLLKAILGEDPVTGDPVPRTADTLIGGFMKLIGQEEIWENLKKSNAVARAWAWFQGAMGELMGFVRQIPSLFVQAFQSLELVDIVLVPRAFAKIVSVFGGFIGRFLSWAGNTIWNLLEIIFAVVAPGAMPYLRKAAGAFRSILKNPIGFVGNLVRAGIMGFRQFAANIGKHLKASLVQWLTGSLGGAGLYIPQSFEIREIIKFVLSVLGLTWQNIRSKLVKVVGETAVKVMETGFDIVVTLVTEGPAAAWEKIKEQLTNLKEMIMEEIMNFVIVKVVQSAITKLVTSLNPAGAFVQAIIAIYNTVMFFIERMKQIIQVAMSFIDSMAAIAAGALGAAANRVETTMAGLLTLVIAFLARLAGLGKVSDAVIGIINKIRAPIDRALDKVVAWIVTMAKKVGRFLTGGGKDPKAPPDKSAKLSDTTVGETVSFSAGPESHRLWVDTAGGRARVMVASNGPGPVEVKLGEWEGKVKELPAEQKAKAPGLLGSARTLLGSTAQSATQAQHQMQQAQAPQAALQTVQQAEAADRQTEERERQLVNVLQQLFALFGEKGVLSEVGPHPMKGQDRESHHVPANELSDVLATSYQAVGDRLTSVAGGKPDLEPLSLLAGTMRQRTADIRSSYAGGSNLSAILVHRDTHRTGARAVHRGSIMDDVLSDIEKTAGSAPDKRVVVMKKDGSRMVANLQNEHWQAFMAQIYAIERQNEAKANTNLAQVSVSGQQAVIQVIGGQKGGIDSIATQMQSEITGVVAQAGTDATQLKAGMATYAAKLKGRINSTMRSAFESALGNGWSAIKVALSSSKEDGDSKLHGPILDQLRSLAKTIWGNITRPL